ncbi:MAG: ABC transporter ATP-binding protein [Ignavibacteriaceae bacterium]
MSLLEIKNITKSFDGLKAVNNFSCEINDGEIVGLIGPNGAGKTTLFNVLTGFLRLNDGKIIFDNKDITGFESYKIFQSGVSRTFQDLRLITQMSLLENVMLYYSNRFGEKLNNIFFKNKNIKVIEEENSKNASSLLAFAGLKEKANEKAGNLSYGQQKLLSLTCCLASDPKLILLDEPVSGIQPRMISEIKKIIKELQSQGKTIFFIEHDMEFVFNIAERVIVMDHGKKIAEDMPANIKSNKEILEAYLA